MKREMLKSLFDALEHPSSSEMHNFNISKPSQQIIVEIKNHLRDTSSVRDSP